MRPKLNKIAFIIGSVIAGVLLSATAAFAISILPVQQGGTGWGFPGNIKLGAVLFGGDNVQLATSTNLTFATTTNTLTTQNLKISGITGSIQCLHVDTSGNVTGTATDCGSSGGTVTSLAATYPLAASASTGAVTLTTAFGTTTNAGIGANLFIYTSNSGVFLGVASSSLHLPNTALNNSSITINSVPVSLGNSIVVASTTLLGDSSTFGGNDTFTNTITGSITGNSGTATKLATGRTIAITGDLTYTSPTFDGSTNVTAAGTLATVNTNVGTFTYPSVTVNGKGLITAISNGTAPTTYTGTFPVIVTGSVISSGYSTTTNTGLGAGFRYIGSGGIDQTAASSSFFGFTPPSNATTLTVAGTANQITSSAGAQDLTANRTWTLSLPNHVIFPTDYVAISGSTTNATTTNFAVVGAAENCNGASALTTSSTGVLGCTAQPQGTLTSIAVSTANGFAGSSSGGATPTLTLTTTITGLLKGNGTAISAATPGTDYDVFAYPFPAGATSSPLTFTGLVTTTNASTTLFSSTYASSTNAFFGTLNLPGLTGTQCLHEISGVVSGTGSDCGSGGGGSVGNWFTPNTDFGALANSTSTPIWLQNGVFASSTSVIDQTTFTGGKVGIASSTPFSLFSINPNGITSPAFTIGSSTGVDFQVDPTAGGDILDLFSTPQSNTVLFGVSNTGVASSTSFIDSQLTSGNCVQAGTGGLLTSAAGACGSGGGTFAQGTTSASFYIYNNDPQSANPTNYYLYNASSTVVTSNTSFQTLLQQAINSLGGAAGTGPGGIIHIKPGVYYANSTSTISGNDQSSTGNSPAIQIEGEGQEATKIYTASNTTFLQLNHQAIPTVDNLSCYYKGGGSCIYAFSTIANSRSIYQFDFHNLFFGATTTVTTAPFVLSNVLRGTVNNIEFFGVHGCAVINEQGNFNAGDFTWTHSMCEMDASAGDIALNFSTSTGATGWVNQVHFTQFDSIADGTGATYIKANPLIWSTFDDMGVEQMETFVDSGNGFDSIGNTYNFKYMTPRSTAGLTMFKMVAGAQGNTFTFGDLNSEQSIVVINDANGNIGDPNMISGYIGQDVGTASVVNSGGTLVVRDIKGYGTMDSTLEPGGNPGVFNVFGFLGISTTSPGTQLSIGTTNGLNISGTGTSTWGSAANGINLNAGCFAIRNVCVGAGSGTVTAIGVTTNQGVSGSSSGGATPNLTITLGALTGVTSFNGLVVTANTGVITTGTWNGTTIAEANGGTGATSIANNMLIANNGSGVMIATSTPSATAFFATSTTATSTFAGAVLVGTTTETSVGITSTSQFMSVISSALTSFGGLLINMATNSIHALEILGSDGQPRLNVDTTSTTAGFMVGSTTVGSKIAQFSDVGLFGAPPINNAFFQIASSSQNATNTLFLINNVGHVIASSTNPVVTCTGGTLTSYTGDDTHGEGVCGTGSTVMTITFGAAWSVAPICTVTNQSMSITSAMSYTITATALTISQAVGMATDKIDIMCEGVKGPQ